MRKCVEGFPHRDFTVGATLMGKKFLACVLAILCFLTLTFSGRALEEKPTDEGKGADFKGKTVEMKDKGEFAILLEFSAGKEVIATTNGDKETDVNLYVYDESKKEVGKDTSPGPKCEVKFTPKKDGKYKLLVTNTGGTNKVTLEVKVAR
jgi:hypothetical protein